VRVGNIRNIGRKFLWNSRFGVRGATSNHTSAVVALKHAYVQRALKHCAHCGGKLSKEALDAQKLNDAARRERQLAEAQWRRAIACRRELEEQQMQEQRERVQFSLVAGARSIGTQARDGGVLKFGTAQAQTEAQVQNRTQAPRFQAELEIRAGNTSCS
jgi:hypothetical protein